jgi:hypothetical protein
MIFALVALIAHLEAAEKALSEEKAARLAADQSLVEEKAAQQIAVSLIRLLRRLRLL